MAIRKRKLKNGKYSWYVDIYVPGLGGQRRIRKYFGKDKRAAERALSEYRRSPTPLSGRLIPTLKEITIPYLAWIERNRSANYHEYIDARLKALLPVFGETRLDLIRLDDIEAYKDARLKEVSALTVNKDLITLRQVYNWCLDRHYLAKMPLKLHLLPCKEKPPRYLSKDKARRLLEACRYNEVLYHLVFLALKTGMRKSELLAVRRQDINWEANHLRVHGKGDKIRYIPMTPKLREHLQAVELPQGLRRDCLDKPLRKASKASGISPPIGFHVLRHTFASWLVMAGEPLPAVQLLLGHARITTTMMYAHLSPKRLQEAVRGLDDDLHS